MTKTVDQQRAEFEAWAIANNKYHVSGYNPHSDLWEAWQAARRAQVVQVDDAIREVMHLIDDWSEKDFVVAEARLDPWSEHDPSAPVQMLEKLDKEANAARLAIEQKLRAMLAAAPQPPSA